MAVFPAKGNPVRRKVFFEFLFVPIERLTERSKGGAGQQDGSMCARVYGYADP